MRTSKYNFVQVYNVWVNGRDINDADQHYPIDSNVDREWHSDFNRAYKDYFGCFAPDITEKGDWNSEIFQDYSVILYSIDIDVEKFEKEYDLKFNLENQEVQEMIPYYDDYKFNTVAEKTVKFI